MPSGESDGAVAKASVGKWERAAARVRRLSHCRGTTPQSWSDAIGDTLTLLDGFGAAFVQIDEPKFKLLDPAKLPAQRESFYYMRLHGRNAAQWWRHDKIRGPLQLPLLGERAEGVLGNRRAAKTLVKKSYLYTNNHFSSKSVVNAVMLKAQLGEPIEGEYPPEIVERYPELEGLVSDFAGGPFIVARRITSVTLSLLTTSMPAMT